MGVALPVGLLLMASAPGAASAGEEQDGEGLVAIVPCSGTVDEDQVVVNDQISTPLEQLRIDEAQEIATGEGVGVAVIDAAVSARAPIATEPGIEIVGGAITLDHGTVVAGLVAGPDREVEGRSLGVGVAPAARIIPVRVVGAVDPEDAGVMPQFGSADVARGLRWVADNAGPADIDIVNLSLNVEDDTPELRAAVEAVQAAGIIVVAATANRDGEEVEPGGPTPVPDGDPVYPAAYPGVLGVTTYVPLEDESGEPLPPETYIKASPDIDVAAPTAGAVSYGPNGSSCVVDSPATSWATAYVSGVLALLAQEFPDEDADELVARLVDTASGVPDQRSTISGAGVVQPLEALTREVDTDRRGRLRVPEQVGDSDGGRADPPPVREDELAESRDDFRWWGLLAGAVLVGAVILRPLLRRIRRS